MMLFHCKLHIVRAAANYGTKEDLTSTIETCISQTGAQFFSIGGGDDFIHIRGIPACAVKFVVLDDGVALHSNAAFQLTSGQMTTGVNRGQKLNFPFAQDDIELFGFVCKMVFPDQADITMKLTPEQEHLSPEALHHLLASYNTVEKIQEGRACLVCRTGSGKALKIVRPSLVKNLGVVTRFLSAARKFQTLPGSLFLKTYEIVYQRNSGLCYAAMELFDGETLQNYLARKGVLSPAEAQQIVFYIAQNLWVMQKYGYCCRNLTPENMLVDKTGRVRVTGFFLLKSADQQLTVSGTQMIIPKYTSPEQARDSSTVDILSDMFSLGAIFYSLVAGVPPFNLGTIRDYKEFLEGDNQLSAEEILRRVPQLDAAMCELMASLLAFDKRERPLPEQLLTSLREHNPALTLNKEFLDMVAGIRPKPKQKPRDESATAEIITTQADESGLSPHILALLDQDALSEDDIDQVQELKILSLEQEPCAQPDIEKAREQLQQVYRQMEQKDVPNTRRGQTTPGVTNRFREYNQHGRRLLLAAAACLLLAITAGVVFTWWLQRHYPRQTKAAPTLPLPAEVSPPKLRPAPVARKEPLPTIGIEKELQGGSLKKWGRHWIGERQYAELEKKWQSGSKPAPVVCTLVTPVAGYRPEIAGWEVFATGGLYPEVLPVDLFDILLEAELQDRQRQPLGYPVQVVKLVMDNRWQANWVLAAPLSPGLYHVRIGLRSASQSDFVRDFLGLEPTRDWHIPFYIGSERHIEEHYRHHLQEICEITGEASELYKKAKNFSQQQIGVQKKAWREWERGWKREMQKLSQRIAARQERRKQSPLLDGVDFRLSLIPARMEKVLQRLAGNGRMSASPQTARQLFDAFVSWKMLADEIEIEITRLRASSFAAMQEHGRK